MTTYALRQRCDLAVQLALMAMLVVVPLVFYTPAHDVFEINKITAFRIFTLLALLAWLTKLWFAEGRLRPAPLWPPVAAVGVSSLLSTIWTNNLPTSIFGVYEDYEGILTMANYVLLWFLVVQQVRTFAMVRRFLAAIILAGALAALYGVMQNFGWDFVMWNPQTYSASRLFGTLGNPNFLAAYVLMALPLAAMAFFLARRGGGKGLLLATVLVMLVCLFFTKSRGAVYALAVQLVLFAAYLIFDRRRPASLASANRRWLIVFAVLAVLSLGAPQVRQAMVSTLQRTAATLDVSQIKLTPRLYIWRSALQMMRDKPLLGSGLDTFQITFPKYRLAEYWRLEWNGTPEKAHNFFLQIGATTGLLGLGVWVWLLAAYFWIMFRRIRSLPPPRNHWAAAVVIAQIGFLVQNQFNFTVVAYGSLFWFLLALGPVLHRESPETPPASAAAAPARTFGERLGYAGVVGVIVLLMAAALRLWTADVFFKRGIIRLGSGDARGAVLDLGEAAHIHPHREIYWVKYGIAHEEAAKRSDEPAPVLARAAEIHRHTIAMNPLNGYDYNNLGRVYKYWGDYLDQTKLAEAETACRRATALDPYNVYFALDLGSVYLSQGRLKEAYAVAERLVALFPDFAIPYSYLGYVRLRQQRIDEAAEHLEAAVGKNWRGDVNTRATTWSNLGIIHARRSALEAAAAAFENALDIKPRYLEARLNLAVIRERQGRDADALRDYRHILRQAPNYPRADALRRKIAILERRLES